MMRLKEMNCYTCGKQAYDRKHKLLCDACIKHYIPAPKPIRIDINYGGEFKLEPGPMWPAINATPWGTI